MPISDSNSDLLVFSHLRWDFVFQRPQHLLSRYTAYRRVFYFEEPYFESGIAPRLEIRATDEGVKLLIPHLPEGLDEKGHILALKSLVDSFVRGLDEYTLWYYTPMALPFTRHLEARAVIFDCMDELSQFKFAPPEILKLEDELLRRSDLVFTGGHSLYEAKIHRHKNIHPFPSSIDREHFGQARAGLEEPDDQKNIPHPRLGFFGVIDERMDVEMLGRMAELKPDWHFVMVGPVVKIDPATLPKHANIHYLGRKSYKDLPAYLSGWDVALMPFALNESTQFISPTKTPEYLAAGRPVVSSAIRDVVRPYGDERLVFIARSAVEFVDCAAKAMHQRKYDAEWIVRVDEFLSRSSWDMTHRDMMALERALHRPPTASRSKSAASRPAESASAWA